MYVCMHPCKYMFISTELIEETELPPALILVCRYIFWFGLEKF